MKSFFPMENLSEKFIKKIKGHSVVTFDVFDTLIKRCVERPIDVFTMMERGMVEKGIQISDFAEKRLKAEEKLREDESFINIYQIYNKLCYLYNIPDDIGKKLCSYEIETELKLSVDNCVMKDVYDYCKSTGKRIIAISDMYLPKSIISKILQKNGYQIDKIYVSCDCKKKKGNGTLFKYVMEKENILKKDVIHFGDSFKSDWKGAILSQIECVHIPQNICNFNLKRVSTSAIERKYEYKIISKFINYTIDKKKSYYYKFGYALIGPIVFYFSLWLLNELQHNEIKDVFFFSRDGYVLKKAFDSINNSSVKSHYLYVSRKAIKIPSLQFIKSYDDILKFIPASKILTVKTFFSDLGLNVYNYLNLLEEYDLSPETEIFRQQLVKNPSYKKIFDTIKKDVILNSSNEYRNLSSYLQQEHLIGKIGVVDIGWHASMQYYLENLPLQKQLGFDLMGFYVGLNSKHKVVPHAEGFIKDKGSAEYCDSPLSFIGLIESVFLAREGSVTGYQLLTDRVYPVLQNYEYKNTDFEFISLCEIQNGINDFVERFKEIAFSYNIYLNGKDVYKNLYVYATRPFLHDVYKFANFRYLSEDVEYLAKTRPSFYYLFHFEEFKKDFVKSRWKIGFMKQILRINLPYYLFYKKLHQIR